MVIDLPTISSNTIIGSINLNNNKISTTQEYISYTCQSSSDCCGTNDFFVPVSDMDIERIENNGYAIDQIIETQSPELRFARDGTAEKHYWMKRKPYTGKCTFLENNLCSIHEFKPFTCRIFPFQLIEKKRGIFDISIHNSNICKSIKNVDEKSSNNKEILTNILSEVKLENKRRQIYFKKYGHN
jgi:Fe-S-cluster containining protein